MSTAEAETGYLLCKGTAGPESPTDLPGSLWSPEKVALTKRANRCVTFDFACNTFHEITPYSEVYSQNAEFTSYSFICDVDSESDESDEEDEEGPQPFISRRGPIRSLAINSDRFVVKIEQTTQASNGSQDSGVRSVSGHDQNDPQSSFTQSRRPFAQEQLSDSAPSLPIIFSMQNELPCSSLISKGEGAQIIPCDLLISARHDVTNWIIVWIVMVTEWISVLMRMVAEFFQAGDLFLLIVELIDPLAANSPQPS